MLSFTALTVVGDGDGASAWARARPRKFRWPCRRRWTRPAARWSRFQLNNGTLQHNVIGKHGAAQGADDARSRKVPASSPAARCAQSSK